MCIRDRVFRAGLDNPDYEFVGINDPFMTPDYCAYMLRYDTVHGQYTVSYTHLATDTFKRM